MYTCMKARARPGDKQVGPIQNPEPERQSARRLSPGGGVCVRDSYGSLAWYVSTVVHNSRYYFLGGWVKIGVINRSKIDFKVGLNCVQNGSQSGFNGVKTGFKMGFKMGLNRVKNRF
jgi:hypothetical protein